MKVASLDISYDRGITANQADDPGLASESVTTECDRQAALIRAAFRERFPVSPIDGLYLVPGDGAAKALLLGLSIPAEMKVRVTEFEIAPTAPLDDDEIAAWALRIKEQLEGIRLGRSDKADASGLDALESIASCPIIGAETAAKLKEIVGLARDGKLTRVEVKQALEVANVTIDPGAFRPARPARAYEVVTETGDPNVTHEAFIGGFRRRREALAASEGGKVDPPRHDPE